MMRAAVLFARKRSIYKSFPDLDVYDAERDALTFNSDLPVIAHPPCRNWGRLSQFSKGDSRESDLAIFAIEKVRANGGVLEHPAYSKLWKYASLPSPGEFDQSGGTTLLVHQCFWGHKAPKPTFLYVCGVSPGDLPDVVRYGPLPPGRIEQMSLAQRESTPLAFANFLLHLALSASPREIHA